MFAHLLMHVFSFSQPGSPEQIRPFGGALCSMSSPRGRSWHVPGTLALSPSLSVLPPMPPSPRPPPPPHRITRTTGGDQTEQRDHERDKDRAAKSSA